ncbi:MAG: hypothetical protein AMXMBFR78_18260 [Rubrivivax sp.]
MRDSREGVPVPSSGTPTRTVCHPHGVRAAGSTPVTKEPSMADTKPQDLAGAAAGVSESLRPICRDSGNYLANALWDMRAILAAQTALLDTEVQQ